MVEVVITMDPIPPSPPPIDSNHILDLGKGVEFSIEDVSHSENPDHKENSQPWLSPLPRAKTRLLSRSHSVSDLSGEDKLNIDLEPLRRNSSGEYNQPFCPLSPMSTMGKPLEHSPSSMTNKSSSMSSDSNTPSPVSSLSHLSPITNLQYHSHQNWKPPKSVPAQEDTFSLLLQTTAERVLNKLKTRQQDLGKGSQVGCKVRKHPHGSHHHVPRKLQPILREGGKTPQSVDGANTDNKNDSDSVSLSIS